ncbi:hypothetical protein FISHEDRAFT_32533 [Fistulina hepatica ATCC 64428]|uniref:Uncharacterized protein n=1 Tax=Fistulina hepatica ATCC 64428 TaxID=1128425 RepID=A0A0D7APU4_9AGAR|nr:hypothetical protein FISHEDRAFT_32533 [Fistulina hepatica ATCC 64428]
MDRLVRGAHLIPLYSDVPVPVDMHYTESLDTYSAFYINSYIDHHAHKTILW